MLKTKLFSFSFFRFIQSGMYIDFIIKKFSEIFVKNIFIYSAQFFGEKYMIEYLTKKIIDYALFSSNKFLGLTDLFYSYYFIQLIGILFYFLTLVNLLFFF